MREKEITEKERFEAEGSEKYKEVNNNIEVHEKGRKWEKINKISGKKKKKKKKKTKRLSVQQ